MVPSTACLCANPESKTEVALVDGDFHAEIAAALAKWVFPRLPKDLLASVSKSQAMMWVHTDDWGLFAHRRAVGRRPTSRK